MGEFANKVKDRAAEVLRSKCWPEPTPEMGPILELIGSLLEDGAGGILSPEEVPVTTEQWLMWNQLAMDHEEEVLRTMTSILERERMDLPRETEAMRNWAAWLLLATLDRMGMQ